MNYIPVNVRPHMGDILIVLNDGTIHEGEYVRVLDNAERVRPLFHIYKSNKYILPDLVKGWIDKSKLTVNAPDATTIYLSKRKKEDK